jgi:hypothetical protein
MQVESVRHPAEELLEKYAMGKIAEDQLPSLEEHLLVCSDCQVRMADMDDYVQAANAAAAELERTHAAGKPSLWEFLSGDFWRIPKPVWAAGLAAAVVAMVVPFAHQSVPGTEVYLSTLRGTNPSATATVNSRAKILLRIDTATIAPAPSYQLQLVSSTGRQIWNTRVIQKDQQISALVPHTLSAGKYWVRLYAVSDSVNPLQEFALKVN